VSAPARPLWVATGNRKKRAELERLLAPLGYALRGLDDLPQPPRIVEDAPDFAGNARIKAVAVAHAAGALALGDDSGLCVDALGGRPGVQSARYGGPGASDADKVRLLLGELRDVPAAARTARFVCSLCLADAQGNVLAAIEDACEGHIAFAPAGSAGFGYDPVFVPTATRRDARGPTMAELRPEDKDAISHRGRALRRLAEFLTGERA
jgi:XTP/dITP diphosphohydrolase